MKKLSLILMSIFALGLITSCSSSNDENVTTGPDLVTGTKTLTINITGANPMAGRSTGTLNSGQLQVPGDEATINNLIVIVYDNVLGKFETANKFVNPAAPGGTITEKVYFKTTNPSVFVLANVPLNAVDAVVGQNMEAFKEDLSASLNLTSIDGTTAGTSQLPTALPMIGSSTDLTANGTETVGGKTIYKYASNVTLHRMVSRVALTSFSTNFSGAGESFTVTDVFLKHVNTTSGFLHADITANAGKVTMNGTPKLGSLYDGMTVATSSAPTASYLRESYASAPWDGNKPAFFYVFPNNASSFDAKTQLVIKGNYVSGTGATPVERYYVCVVNAVPDGSKVTYEAPVGGSIPTDAGSGTISANRTYSLKVTVTGAPQEPNDVAQDVDPTPQGSNNVELTITVANWAADIIQNVSF